MEQQTLLKMTQMRMKGMAQTYHDDIKTGLLSGMTITEYLSRITDAEWECRQNRKIVNLKKAANFRQSAHPLNIDYTINRNLDKEVMQRLLNFDFLKNSENIIFTGMTGTGKSYLAQALGASACEQGYKTQYYTLSTMTEKISEVKIQGVYPRWLKKIQNTALLIIDDFGLTSLEPMARKVLMDIVDYRYSKHSVIIVSQIPVKNWHELIGESTIADAILDRIVHNAHRIELKGESVRRSKKIER